MTFLQWTFLFGVVAVAGPVLAHLLAKPRFKRLPFTMLQFLKNSQTESHSRRRFRDLLILLLRCTIIVLIALLFAQPILYVKHKPKDTKHIYYLGLDNSTSMSYTDGQSSYFERMKDSAIGYIVSTEANAVFKICPLVSGIWTQELTKQQALAEVKALKINTGSADIDAFLSGVVNDNRNINPDNKVFVLLISDFTPNTLGQFLNFQEPALVDNFKYKTIVSSRAINNASIVNVKTLEVNYNELEVNVTITNHGQTKQNRQLTAKVGNNKSASIDVELLPDQVKIFPVRLDTDFNTGMHSFVPVELNLSPGDGLKDDDNYYLSVRLPEKKEINIILTEASEDQMFLLDTAMQTLSGRDSAGIIRIRRIGIYNLDSSNIDWADVCIFSGIEKHLAYMANTLAGFVKAGGKAVFFMTGETDPGAINQLWRLGVLPALPKKFTQAQTYPEISPFDKQFLEIDSSSTMAIAAKAMSNYRIDRIPVTGFWECEPHVESKCLWRYQNEHGFIYCKQIDNGMTFLVNTSADGSLGSLAKSSASVALCRYLLGEYNRVRDFSFTCDQRIVLPVADFIIKPARQKQLWVQNCNGARQQAFMSNSSILMPDAGGVGWVKTLTEPVIYAGVNLPVDETNMSKPIVEEVGNALERVFLVGNRNVIASADSLETREQKPIWKTLVWIIIVFLLTESVLANRLKR